MISPKLDSTGVALPPLPAYGYGRWYTAEQMREYAAQVARAENRMCARAVLNDAFAISFQSTAEYRRALADLFCAREAALSASWSLAAVGAIAPGARLDGFGVALVDPGYFWNLDMGRCPHGAKVQLRTKFGIAIHGHVSGANAHSFTGWTPLPKMSASKEG